MKHLKHVDGLRAFAVLAVLAYHAAPSWVDGGYLGVDVFFAISGFVVTAALAQHGAEPFRSFISGFYRRRMTRILPALLVVLVLTSAAWVLLIPSSWLSAQSERVGLFAFAGLSNWALTDQGDAYFAPRAEFSPFTHTWSLGVEEQFYLLAPLLIFLAFRLYRLTTGAMAGLALASLALATLWSQTEPTLAFYSIATRLWELAAGALWYLVFWQQRHARLLSNTALASAAAKPVAALVLTLAVCLAQPGAMPMLWMLAAVIGTLALIGTDGMRGSVVTDILAAPSLRWIGLRSYSLYLWHWPIFVFMRWTIGMDAAAPVLAATALAFVAAGLSYRWVEVPLRSSKRWTAVPTWIANLALLCVAAVSAGSAYLLFEDRHEVSLSTVERNSADWYPVHHDPTLPPVPCSEGGLRYTALGRQTIIEHLPCTKAAAGEPAKALFVLGDSHATAYLPMFHRLSRDQSVHVIVYQSPGCPYIDLNAPMGVRRPAQCLLDARAAVADLLNRAAPGDVVMLPSLRLPRFGDQWAVDQDEAVLQRHFSAVQAQLREASIDDAEAWIKPFLDRQLRVILTAPLPIFRAPPFRCVDAWTRRNPICAHGTVESRADELKYRAPVVAALSRISARHDPARITIFDPFDALCSADRCSAIDTSDRPLFFDADHISRWGNEVVYPSFRQHWLGVSRQAL